MVNYICSICNKKFNHKGDYTRHINRKKTCNVITSIWENIKKSDIKSPSNCSKTCTVVQKNEQFKCKYCKKTFKKKFNLKRHVKTCKKREK